MATYCVQADLEGRLSAAGVSLRTAPNPGAVTSAINQASRRIDFFLLPRYGPGLTASAWVTDACTTLGAVYLCLNLGNPPPEGVLFAYEELLGKDGQGGLLESIRLGQAMVPDIAALVTGAPRLTNYHVDERTYGQPVVVAEPARSTKEGLPQPPRKERWGPLWWGNW